MLTIRSNNNIREFTWSGRRTLPPWLQINSPTNKRISPSKLIEGRVAMLQVLNKNHHKVMLGIKFKKPRLINSLLLVSWTPRGGRDYLLKRLFRSGFEEPFFGRTPFWVWSASMVLALCRSCVIIFVFQYLLLQSVLTDAKLYSTIYIIVRQRLGHLHYI